MISGRTGFYTSGPRVVACVPCSGEGTNIIRTADRANYCLADALLLGGLPLIGILVTAAALSAGWMYQRRYYSWILLCCSSAAVACTAVAPATSAMWPAVGHGGRPRNEAAGPLPAVGLNVLPERQRRQNN
jgi:hypothetical protein